MASTVSMSRGESSIDKCQVHGKFLRMGRFGLHQAGGVQARTLGRTIFIFVYNTAATPERRAGNMAFLDSVAGLWASEGRVNYPILQLGGLRRKAERTSNKSTRALRSVFLKRDLFSGDSQRTNIFSLAEAEMRTKDLTITFVRCKPDFASIRVWHVLNSVSFAWL